MSDPANLPSPPYDYGAQYNDFLAAAKDGQFWIGSTAKGRSEVDRIPPLVELIEWAIAGRRTAQAEMEAAERRFMRGK